MSRVFVDTWAWYALTDPNDADHELARLANDELLDAAHTFVITNFVLDETLTLVRYNIGHAAAVKFRHTLDQLIAAHLVQFVRIGEDHEAAAWRTFERYADQEFSYTDCTSFSVMRALKLTHIFTGDSHFATMGFVVVPAA